MGCEYGHRQSRAELVTLLQRTYVCTVRSCGRKRNYWSVLCAKWYRMLYVYKCLAYIYGNTVKDPVTSRHSQLGT